MTRVRLGAVGYLNARPLVWGLDRSQRFALRFDVPSKCAELLHANAIDVGLIPSAEYARGAYRIVPGLAIGSRGPVASVSLYTKRAVKEIRSIALDSSSRTSVALTRVLCARLFGIQPALDMRDPDLEAMLASSDAALIIGDRALSIDGSRLSGVETIDLGEAWTRMTSLPFVYAFWAGRSGALEPDDVRVLEAARDAGTQQADEIARAYFDGAPALQRLGARYLRDNIRYDFGDEEREGLMLFYRYAAELGILPAPGELRFY